MKKRLFTHILDVGGYNGEISEESVKSIFERYEEEIGNIQLNDNGSVNFNDNYLSVASVATTSDFLLDAFKEAGLVDTLKFYVSKSVKNAYLIRALKATSDYGYTVKSIDEDPYSSYTILTLE